MEYKPHIYDIEFFEIFDSLRSKYSNNSQIRITPDMSNSDFIDLQVSQVLAILAEEGINKGILSEKRECVVSSISTAFLPLIGWRILTIDPYLIEGLLDYQYAIYNGNYLDLENNFIGLLEFVVYPFVKSNNYLNEDIRLERIMNWVNSKRTFIRMSDKPGLKSKLNKEQLESLHQCLLGTYINEDTRLENFLAAYEEKPLPYNFKPINWLVPMNALYGFLELTTNYINKDGKHYLPDKIKEEIIPNIFVNNDERGIILNKRPGTHSKYIKQIEECVNACTNNTSGK